MASSKARPGNRPGTGAGTTRGSAGNAGRPARTSSLAVARNQPRDRPAAESDLGQRPSGPPAWFRIVTLVLAIAGLGVSAYLTYTHFADKALLFCSDMGSCEKVTTSPQSMIFGVIPVAVTGLAYYVYLVAIMSPWAWNSTWKWMPKLRLVSMAAGIGMVLYLLYAELIQVGAICPYCTTVHIITFVLFVLVTLSAALWGLAPATPRQQSPAARLSGPLPGR